MTVNDAFLTQATEHAIVWDQTKRWGGGSGQMTFQGPPPHPHFWNFQLLCIYDLQNIVRVY
jgi:hypothetical protein